MDEELRRPRLATPDDAFEVARLLHDFNTEFDEYTSGADVLAERAPEFISSGKSTYLLAGSPPVGIAELRFRDSIMSGKPVAYLEELYVAASHRRQGLGRALLERAIALARERGAAWIELGTATSDTAARRLYESIGFTNEERPGDPESRMLYYELEL